MMNNLLEEPLGIDRILDLLPHRYPFLLVDRIQSLQLEPEKRLLAEKSVTVNEPFFQGHFPGHPVMPGVLIVEALAQAAGVLAHLDADRAGRPRELYYLARLDRVRFSRVVVPGDRLELDVVQKRVLRGMRQYVCAARVDNRPVASCEILCAGRKP